MNRASRNRKRDKKTSHKAEFILRFKNKDKEGRYYLLCNRMVVRVFLFKVKHLLLGEAFCWGSTLKGDWT
jgi:hypothetical protein